MKKVNKNKRFKVPRIPKTGVKLWNCTQQKHNSASPAGDLGDRDPRSKANHRRQLLKLLRDPARLALTGPWKGSELGIGVVNFRPTHTLTHPSGAKAWFYADLPER